MALIPINDLQRRHAPFREQYEQKIQQVVRQGWYVLGPEVEQFEQEFATYCQAEFAVGVANGTDALELALRALDLPPQAQVATVANAGMYSTHAILAVGAVPLYIDLDPVTMTMDPQDLQERLTERTRAVIVTHLYGQMAAMPSLIQVAASWGIPLVEDCAQAHGAQLEGKPAGSWGDLGCFSFYPTKNLGALGDGGALVTSKATLAQAVRSLRQYGWEQKYLVGRPGGRNSRLDELQAALLRLQLPHLSRWNQRRADIATKYTQGLQDLGLELPQATYPSCVAHLYVLRCPWRDHLRACLREQGIGTDIHYPQPDHQQVTITPHPFAQVSLPVTERVCGEVLTLPCFPELADTEVDQVISAVRAVSHG